jgi:hypothetical protein
MPALKKIESCFLKGSRISGRKKEKKEGRNTGKEERMIGGKEEKKRGLIPLNAFSPLCQWLFSGV